MTDNIPELIRKTRDGEPLSAEELRLLANGAADGSIPDYQLTAWLMAVRLKGMRDDETAALTEAMAQSGDTVDLSRFGDRSVDKHSTGGVGDKTTLIVAPLVAALGGKVAKMSGRGLGHTGGTVDKLEAIPGYRTALTPSEFLQQVADVGVAVVGQTGALAPADKKLYALRDVTATVDSLPLIASSIMSKKLAAGARSIVLDVKVGSGAFMKTLDDARRLAERMVAIGTACGRRMAAVLTNMDIPLGHAVGNALEVAEAAAVLRGEGCPDLREVCVTLATHMTALCLQLTPEEARACVLQALDGGAGYEVFRQWIAAQGGDTSVLDDPARFPQAAVVREVIAPQDGWIAHMDAQAIGDAAVTLGAGRRRKEDAIDPAAGILLDKKTGEQASRGERIARLYTADERAADAAEQAFLAALRWCDAPPERAPLILDTIVSDAIVNNW